MKTEMAISEQRGGNHEHIINKTAIISPEEV
jgi:hypothetical protein